MSRYASRVEVEHADVIVVGGGPAGLRAAEMAARAGRKVILLDQMRSVGRKFLIAGKGGLNITNNEDAEGFVSRYAGSHTPEGFWEKAFADFSNDQLREWAAGLGVETFVASSGRVYPKALKAAPLLRRWVKQLKDLGVEFRLKHRLTKLREDLTLTFENEEGELQLQAGKVVLALGGASWPRTGSDGKWLDILKTTGIPTNDLVAANCGWEVAWPNELAAKIEGQPLKNLVARAAAASAIGELMLTRYGIEGGPIYQLGPQLREMASPILSLDLKPSFSHERLIAKMESARRDFLKEARLRWKLPQAACDVIEHFHGKPDSASELAKRVKNLEVPLQSPRPIAEAISSAGGVKWSALDSSLMSRTIPNLHFAGEMIDWEAPTGGYLLQACFMTGGIAGRK